MPGDDIFHCPPFIPNELDPLFDLNEKIFHMTCFNSYPMAIEAKRRLDELKKHISVNAKVCLVCHQKIDHPNEYFQIPYLVDHPSNTIRSFQYAEFHKKCIKNWPERHQVLNVVLAMKKNNLIKGMAYDTLIRDLNNSV
jgi:hypothetical protein